VGHRGRDGRDRRAALTTAASPGAGPRWQTVGGPTLFVLLWSTGFVGAKYGLPYAEPFTFLGLRLVIAAGLLAALAAALRSVGMESRAQYGHAALVGLLLHAGYLGGVFYAISLGVPAGVSAVVVSLQPVLTAVLASRVLDERLIARQWLGLLVGVAGVALVVGPGIAATSGSARSVPVTGLLACLVALASGTAATIHQKRHGQGIPLVWGTAVQYAAASAVLLALAATTETMSITWTGDFVLALVWLVLALSLGAVLLLLLLLRRGTAAGVSSLMYLVPPAVVVEAFLLFGERLSAPSFVGVGVTALGVALVVTPPRVRTVPAPDLPVVPPRR
jgi:drug/metabolite transporter (DMT)-like permease